MYSNSSTSRSCSDRFISQLQSWEDYGIGVFLLILAILSILGNGLSVIVFRSKHRHEESPAELFLLNIAVVNLVLSVAVYPAVIISAFRHHWVFGELGCTVYGLVCYFLGLTTIFSLTALAVVRYLVVCRNEMGRKIGRNTGKLIIFSIYLYSMFWAVIPLLGLGGYDVEPFGVSCTLKWHSRESVGRIHLACIAIFCLSIPTVVIVLSHAAIYQHVGQAKSCGLLPSLAKRKTDMEEQLFKITWAVCAGFLFAWSPYAVFSIWATYGDPSTMPVWSTPIPAMLAKSSIAYNPFIYVLLTRTYRTEFKQAFLKVTRWGVLIGDDPEASREQLPLCTR